MLARKAIEERAESGRVFDHRKVAAGDLDWVDAQQFARHEPLPRRLEDLVLSRANEDGRDMRRSTSLRRLRGRLGSLTTSSSIPCSFQPLPVFKTGRSRHRPSTTYAAARVDRCNSDLERAFAFHPEQAHHLEAPRASFWRGGGVPRWLGRGLLSCGYGYPRTSALLGGCASPRRHERRARCRSRVVSAERRLRVLPRGGGVAV